MSENIFEVIYTGKIVAGTDKKELAAQLAELFKVPRQRIPKLFSAKGAVVARFKTEKGANSFAAACKRAGVICAVREKAGKAPAAASDRQPATGGARGYNSVRLNLGPEDVELAPQAIVRLGSYGSGIKINRRDLNEIAFKDITRLAVFREGDNMQLMFFCNQSKRPFVAQSMEIAYGEFPITPEPRTENSLRKIALHILKGNTDIIIDADTDEFLKGRRPVEPRHGPIALSTALAEAEP